MLDFARLSRNRTIYRSNFRAHEYTRRHCDREGSARDTSVIVILSTREKEREGGDVEVAQNEGFRSAERLSRASSYKLYRNRYLLCI